MADRFFAIDDDVEEEEEQQEEEQQEETEETKQTGPKVNPFFALESFSSNTKRVVLSEKAKRWSEMRKSMDIILDYLTLCKWRSAFTEFQNLQRILKKASKVIKENGIPNFFIRNLFDINQKIQDQGDMADLKRFSKELSPLIQTYQSDLEAFEQKPSDFDDPEEENAEIQEEEEEKKEAGGINWFESSDDEEANNIKQGLEDSDDEDRPKGPRRREMTAADAVLARLEAEKNKVITDEIAYFELQKASASRTRGKIITTTSRIFELLNAAKDAELQRKLKLEICFMIAGSNPDEAIEVSDWRVVLTVLPELVEDATQLIAMFNRLDRDFWARSIDTQILFADDTAALHTQYPKYIEILRLFSKTLIEKKEFALALHLEELLINHLYTRVDTDVSELTFSILELTSNEKIMEEEMAKVTQIRAALYLAINLSVRGNPEDAAKIIKGLPNLSSGTTDFSTLSSDVQRTMILFNRGIVYIGICAFEKGNYALSAQALINFSNTKKMSPLIGQSPIIYAPWQLFETTKIEIAKNLSIMMADLPFLVSRCDESRLLIKLKNHKEIEREPVLFKPEDSYRRMISAIDKTKHGEWKGAWELVKDDYSLFAKDNEERMKVNFLEDLKRMGLCVYLQTGAETFDSISIEVLEKKFEMKHSEVLEIIKKMKEGIAPVTKARIDFAAELIEGEKYLSFEAVEVRSPLVEFGIQLGKKSGQLEEVIPGDMKKKGKGSK